MKRIDTFKVITTTLLLTALMSTTAFAAVGQPNLVQGDLTTTSVGQVQQVKAESTAKNTKTMGKVVSAVKKDNSTTIEISNDNGGLIFHADKGVFVIDQKTNKLVSLDDIKAGMNITGIYDKLAPMALSMPGQTSAAIGFIINSDDASMDLSVYNETLTNWENTLKLNISPSTKITDAKETKKVFTAEDIKSSECIVLYSVSTRSIPAQTNPEMVIILNTAAELAADKDKEEIAKVEYVSLREVAEAKGYKVTWTSNKAPIVIEKDGTKATVTIGSDAFTFEHMTKDIKPLDRMEKLDGPTKIEAGKTMVAKSFGDAL